MACIEQRNGSYRVVFRHDGAYRKLSLGKVSEAEAKAKATQVEYLLMRLDQGLLSIPPGVDVLEFVRHDGNPPPPPGPIPATPPRTTLAILRDRFLATHADALEGNTLRTARIHLRHLATTLGEQADLADVAQPEIQGHVARRSGEGIASATIRKEVDTLRSAWNWGRRAGLVSREWPGIGLAYPRTAEKPPFLTRAEIERRIARGGVDPDRVAALWECLYLGPDELADLLAHVSAAARHPWIHPMVATAAHTGARRSELLRAEVGDVDLDARIFTVREKKRVRGRQTNRRVPISTTLAGVLSGWLAEHPGGHWLFCHAGAVARSRTRSAAGEPLTVDETNHHLGKTLANSPWSVVPGWHTLRHGFASICASRGVDQRVIDAWMGHQTEEQRRRYQHLFPRQQRDAMSAAFD